MMNSQRGYATIAVVSLVAAIQVWLEAYLGHVIPIGWYTGPAMFTSCVLHILQIVGLVGGIMWTAIPGDSTFGERFDVKCKWQVEIDDYATRVLEKHWPDVRRCRDICDFPPRGPDHWRVDCICGGFPCQDISYAGNGPVLRASVPACFTRRCEVIGKLGPRVVVLENVAALLTRGLPDVLGSLASFGFDAEWHCIPAAAVGAPHIRDRILVADNAN